MNVGAAQIDLTSLKHGLELSGFAGRTQPSTGSLDPILAKAIYVEHDDSRLLWLSVDALAFDRATLEAIRAWAKVTHALCDDQMMLSATHTHSAPATVSLTNCGRVDGEYLAMLQNRLRDCANAAIAKQEAAELLVCETSLDLAIDRRGKPSAHTDPYMLALGWRNRAGSFVACAVNYAMHPVTLGSENRKISADWCGRATGAMSAALPGQPIALFGNGACGNLNPPVRGDDKKLIDQLGRTVANPAAAGLMRASPIEAPLKARRTVVELPLEKLSHDAVDQIVAHELAKPAPNPRWKETFHETLDIWRAARHKEIDAGLGDTATIEMLAIRVGKVTIIGVTGEIFSRFTADLRTRMKQSIYAIGFANGVFGYIPTSAAYDEGGYEPDVAHYFYNTFRAKRGGHELLVDRATTLLKGFD